MPIPQLASENHKLGMLDGLRGLMALWVLLGHSCILTGFYIPVLSSPGDAVQGFMILSGFLMTYHYILREPKEPWGAWTTWTAFWTRRYFRITPLYFLVLIPTFLLMPRYVFWRSRLDQLHGTVLRFGGMPTLNWLNLFVHASYIYGLLPRYCSSLVIPDWSISLEMQFYFVFPFLMILSARIGWAWLSALCAGVWLVAHASGVSHSFVEPSPLYISIIWFLIGMLWASHFLKPARRNQFAIAGCALA
ncbi:MAG: acyltransferase, partial [Formivibrio sp.]|nr:acyltransferase [Formivibrio sp.]